MNAETDSRCASGRAIFGWLAPMTIAAVVVLGGVLAVPAVGQGSTGAAQGGDRAAAAEHLTLVIAYSEGVEKRWSRLEWKAGMTVAQALAAADGMPGPLGVDLESRGDGERYFVSSIDGLANQGGGKTDRNWVYFVNGEMAKKSAGLVEVSAGDTITWRYITIDWSKAQ